MDSGTLSENLRETLDAFDEAGTPQTTPEVAAQLDLGRRTTYARLERLVEAGRLKTKKVGASARVWWQPTLSADATGAHWSSTTESLVGEVLANVEVGLFILDENFEVAWINEATERYFGLDREQVLGRDKRRLLDEQISGVVENPDGFTETVLSTDEDNTDTERFECRVPGDDDRRERWLEHRSKPIESGEYAGGRVELYYDITERKRTERARREEHAEFTSLVEGVEEYAIFTLDAEGYVQTWNPGAEQIKGYTTDEIVGEHFSAFYTEADRAAGVPEANLAEAARNGSVEDEGWRVREDGERFWANVTLSAIRDDDGELTGYAKVTRDMTDRRAYERQLRDEKAFTESILDNQQDLVYAIAPDGTFRRWSDSFLEVTGYSAAEIEQMRPEDLMADRAAEETTDAIQTVIERRESNTVELPLETKAGEVIPYEFTGGPIVDDGAVVGLAGIGRDISERKARERRLQRQRDDLEAELDDVFQRIDDAMLGLSEDWQVTYLNDRAEELLDTHETDLVGKNVWNEFPEALDRSYRERYERAMETNESVSFEEYVDGGEMWLELSAYPSESGLSIYFRDITERKERERELEQYETIMETVWDGVYALDHDDRFILVNDAFCDIVGYERDELLGRHPTMVNSETVNEAANEIEREIVDGDSDVGLLEYEFETANGERVPVETRFGPYEYGDGQYGRCGVTRDITERRERERELEESRRRYQTLVENFPNGAVTLVDEELRYLTVGGTPIEEADRTVGELEGSPIREVLPPAMTDLLVPRYEAALDGETSTFEADFGEKSYQFRIVPVSDDDGAVFAAMGMSQDVTAQKKYERYLEDAKSQLEAATQAGAIGTWEWDIQDDEMVVGQSFAELFAVDPGSAHEGVSPDQFMAAIHEDDRDRVEEEIAATIDTCGEYKTEYRVRNGDGEYRWVVARGHVECDEDGEPLCFLGALTDITDQKKAELELEQQQRELTVLNNLNEVVQEITSAVIEQSRRDEIESSVCEHLAASDSYEFAWVCEVDAATGAVRPRAEAGVEGYIDNIPVSIDGEDTTGQGPTGKAVRTGEVQVANAFEDADFEPWREYAQEYGYQASAAIPIVHEGTLYGVLGVYADRPRAFDGQEREVVGQLGEIIGHAIGAAERKQALMSDELVEIEFQIPDVFAALDIPAETSGRITLDHAVPVGDDEFLVYGTATPDARETLTALADNVSHWQSVSVQSKGDPIEFVLRVVDPPVLSVLAARGGYLEGAVVEDGDYQMTIHLAPSVDVRAVIDAVVEAYPTVEMLRRQQITRNREDPQRAQRDLLADLTDRQRTALETAVHSGFYEWPRAASGEDIAASIGVAPPTFHSHLRKAQRKVFESIFPSTVPATS